MADIMKDVVREWREVDKARQRIVRRERRRVALKFLIEAASLITATMSEYQHDSVEYSTARDVRTNVYNLHDVLMKLIDGERGVEALEDVAISNLKEGD